MKVIYDVLDPTGNITILVRTPVPEADQPDVAAHLMELEPETEQVGFLSSERKSSQNKDKASDSDCDIYLRMAGGEFCGNASMCAAVIAAMESEQSSRKVNLRVSGASGIVRAEVARRPDGDWTGTVDMPKPASIEEVSLPEAGTVPIVRFEGISHVILLQQIPRDKAPALALVWCKALEADAVGLLFLDQEKSTMTPLVYVPAAQTLCWEKSCASGTTAVCAWLAALKAAPHIPSLDRSASNEHAPCSICLFQPGGELQADADKDGAIRLTGRVKLLKRAETEIPVVT